MLTRKQFAYLGVLLFGLSSWLYACDITYVDTGYVRDPSGCSVQNDVIIYNTVRHNHWESGGTFTISDTTSTGNSWSVGAAAGYEATTSAQVKASVLGSVTVAAKVGVEVSGQLTGSGQHSLTVTDSIDKQHCKCPVYKQWIDKPTEAGYRKVEQQWDFCPDPDGIIDLVQISEYAEGSATGDENQDGGVTSHYNFTQSDCSKDCYGTGGDCPGTP